MHDFLTRRRLYLTYAARRTQFGDSSERQPSRFFRDIPAELLQGTAPAIQARRKDWVASPSSTMATRLMDPSRDRRALASVPPMTDAYSARPGADPVSSVVLEMKAGSRVSHPKFGEGVIVSVVARGGDQEVSVAFSDTVKKLLQSYANLTLVST